MSRKGYKGTDMTEPEGRAGLRHRQQRGVLVIEQCVTGTANADKQLAEFEQYCRDKGDPHAEAWGDDR